MTCKTCDGPCLCTPASSLPPAKTEPKAEAPRYTLRQARAIVARSAAEFLEGAAEALAGDALEARNDPARRDSPAAENSAKLSLAARELRAVILDGAAKLERPRVVVVSGDGKVH